MRKLMPSPRRAIVFWQFGTRYYLGPIGSREVGATKLPRISTKALVVRLFCILKIQFEFSVVQRSQLIFFLFSSGK